MATLNALDPTPEQIKDFLGHPKSGEPVFMLNLPKFRDRATYKDAKTNAENDVSGRVAYNRYASGFSDLLKEAGMDGGAIFGGNANVMMIGTSDMTLGQNIKEWDAVAIVKYPDAATMFKMVSSDDYRKIHKHRRAGLAGQLLISCDDSGVF